MSNEKVDYMRQTDIFNPDDYEDRQIEIIGAGGIGSFTALALAKLGLKKIRVWDGDKVEPHNIPNQLHLIKAVGMDKVQSTKALCKQLAGVEIETVNKFWADGDGTEKPLEGVVISAVDHIRKTQQHPTSGREELWEALKTNAKVELLIDARIGGETIHIYSLRPVNDIFLWKWYEETLFPEEEIAEEACTARAIIDVGFAVGSKITNLVRKWLKEKKVTNDIIIDMHGLEILKPEVRRA